MSESLKTDIELVDIVEIDPSEVLADAVNHVAHALASRALNFAAVKQAAIFKGLSEEDVELVREALRDGAKVAARKAVGLPVDPQEYSLVKALASRLMARETKSFFSYARSMLAGALKGFAENVVISLPG